MVKIVCGTISGVLLALLSVGGVYADGTAKNIELPIKTEPAGVQVKNNNSFVLCEKTPCSIYVPAHERLVLRFSRQGYNDYTWETADPYTELLRGGVRVYLIAQKEK